MFLIQGVFFQNQEGLGVRMKPVDGAVCVIEKVLLYSMYAGIISSNPDFPPQLVGGMFDYFGESVLSEIEVNDIQVRFKKQYTRRSDTILYTFKKRDRNTWAGKYRGKMVGEGLSRCVITEVDDSFNDPTILMKLLGSKTAHAWKKR
jgi:hypothetical protein